MSFMVVMEHVYLQCIAMSLWNITLLTSFLKPMHIFASNFVYVFCGWTLTKFVKIKVLPLSFMELWVILCNFFTKLKKFFLHETIDLKSFIFGLESPQGLFILVC